jgi:hypothetical protein
VTFLGTDLTPIRPEGFGGVTANEREALDVDSVWLHENAMLWLSRRGVKSPTEAEYLDACVRAADMAG